MADLQIDPQPRQFVGQAPQFPSNAPVQEQIQRSSQQVQQTLDRAGDLLLLVNKQREYNESAQAISDFHKQTTDLDISLKPQLNFIHDPVAKTKMYSDQMNSIITDLKSKYPNMSPVALKQIEDSYESYRHQYFFSSLGVEHKRQEDAANNSIKDLTLQAATAGNKDNQERLMHTGMGLIQQQVDSGVWTAERGQFEQTKFIKGVHIQQAADLINHDPGMALNVIRNDPLISPTDKLKLISSANHIIDQNNAQVEHQWRTIQTGTFNELLTNPNRTANDIEKARSSGAITDTQATYLHGGTRLPRESNQLMKHHFDLEVSNADTVDKLEEIRGLARYHLPDAADFGNINDEINKKEKTIGNSFNAHIINRYKSFDNMIKKGTLMPLDMALKYDQKYQQAIKLLNDTQERAKNAKDIAGVDAAFDQAEAAYNNIGKKPEVVPTAKPSPAATATPAAGESPEDAMSRKASQALVTEMYHKYLAQGNTPQQALKRVQDYFANRSAIAPTMPAPATTATPAGTLPSTGVTSEADELKPPASPVTPPKTTIEENPSEKEDAATESADD